MDVDLGMAINRLWIFMRDRIFEDTIFLKRVFNLEKKKKYPSYKFLFWNLERCVVDPRKRSSQERYPPEYQRWYSNEGILAKTSSQVGIIYKESVYIGENQQQDGTSRSATRQIRQTAHRAFRASPRGDFGFLANLFLLLLLLWEEGGGGRERLEASRQARTRWGLDPRLFLHSTRRSTWRRSWTSIVRLSPSPPLKRIPPRDLFFDRLSRNFCILLGRREEEFGVYPLFERFFLFLLFRFRESVSELMGWL